MQAHDEHLRLQDVGMRFGTESVLEGISLVVPRGKIGVIIGGSGAGKTTLVRIIVALLRPSQGSVFIDGEDIARMRDPELQRARAKWAMVFQYSALLDSLTVLQNVVLPLDEHEKGLEPAERRRRAVEMLESLDLAGTEDRYPDELSGGMRKRVALARALIRRPSLIVYDEPASGLDPLTARLVDDLILQTRARFGVTSLVITHDMGEAQRLADCLYVLDKGRLVAQGPPRRLRAEAGSLAARFFEASGIGT
ncbi:MAG TPA: ATP-binding cassette domain-containing protein [Polyangiales bacterium]|nr:ATP-binding cassette domain-containing protein [Polyangiales bacterium]